VLITPAVYAERNQRLDELLAQHGRQPNQVRRSLMTGCWYGPDDTAVQNKLNSHNLSLQQAQERGLAVGTANQIVDQLGQWADAGVQRIMLQWLDLDDIDGLEQFAHAILPQL